MGSSSDWETLRHTAETLAELGVAHEVKVVSAHRTPDLMFEYAASAEARGFGRGIGPGLAFGLAAGALTAI